ncbi:Glycosyltransferase involved in cell wall bisynthesis [Lachnospiraceae bacterium]|nr:Glycosyltransferase involved in cell wall bisynthesis [Lachnospiraceae bacterium]
MFMRILLVHNFYRVPGGEDTVFRNEKALLEAHGHEVLTYTRDNRDMKPWHMLTEAVYSHKTYREVMSIIREKKPDVVHVHNTQFLISASVFKAARDAGVPVFQTLHNFRTICLNAMLCRDGKVCRDCCPGNGFDFKQGVTHACYRGSRIYSALSARIHEETMRRRLYDGVNLICLTELNRKIILESGLADEKRVFVKPNFTDFKVKKSNTRDMHKFLFLGRLDPMKGIEGIMEQWTKVPETETLLVCGSGDADYEEKLREKYGHVKNIRFLGGVAHDRAMEILSESAALIFSSTLLEGLPMTIIESFFTGTPVLAMDFGNGGDIVSEIYGSREPLMKNIAELPDRIRSFERDSEGGRYAFSADSLGNFMPDRNHEFLMEIYRKGQMGV